MSPLTVFIIIVLIVLWLETVRIDKTLPFMIFIGIGICYQLLRAIGII